MKLKVSFILICLVLCCHTIAQNQRWIVQGNDDINSSIPDSVKYKYSSFTSGRVTFKDGTKGSSFLNYNLLLGEVQFVSLKGDTLSLANENTIRSISINQDTFYYDNVYLQFIAGNTSAKLAKSEKMRLADIKKRGGFENYTSSGGIENYSSLNIGARTLHLTENKQLIFITHIFYYIGDPYYHFLPATKRNVLKMFSKRKGLAAYLNENKIDFSKEEDLKKLLAYLNTISQ
ncbi:hypothetical protein FC093_10855 [Ilyomonas limi]|uniref:DUF4369 domain-containing protein n=1 Tax=Ilyomonas limi TaxID=2575867 RepID=A0A4U3L0I7_9BACT|nr:hypothetical protein [Ilyomonas limi]TKK68611.1 hypothetical protein FC093_10855 [Ilyomonas limi]